MRRMLMVFFVSLLPSVAHSASATPQCDRKDETQFGLDVCADADYKAADAKLNQAYAKVMKRLGDDADGRKLLQGAQRAWIAFRDAECNFQTNGSKDGTIYPMEVSLCRRGLTEERTKALDAYLNCGEGDPSCPVPPQ
jgi:uncharacterized protein YecT (DUF1311 family)